jgi:hypothetical protein
LIWPDLKPALIPSLESLRQETISILCGRNSPAVLKATTLTTGMMVLPNYKQIVVPQSNNFLLDRLKSINSNPGFNQISNTDFCKPRTSNSNRTANKLNFSRPQQSHTTNMLKNPFIS